MIKRKVENWSVGKLNRERPRIAFPEYQREKSLWTTEKKSLLIDSILRDIDIPKLYFNRLKNDGIEVIDGQQRLWSIWEFLDDEFSYSSDGKALVFSKLSKRERDAITSYVFQVTVFEEADDDYLRVLFVRLQLGLVLNTGERLNAEKGAMKDLVFDELSVHPFIKQIGIPRRRFAKQTLCAQICINSFTRAKLQSFARTRYDDLLHFFGEYSDPKGKDRDLFDAQSESITQVMDQLFKCFGEKTKELRNRSFILSIYLFIENVFREGGDFSKIEQETFSKFVFLLWRRLRAEARLGLDRENRELYSFQTLLSSAPGEEYQIARRHRKLTEYYENFKSTGKIPGDPDKYAIAV